jgi:hypothetical protein
VDMHATFAEHVRPIYVSVLGWFLSVKYKGFRGMALKGTYRDIKATISFQARVSDRKC